MYKMQWMFLLRLSALLIFLAPAVLADAVVAEQTGTEVEQADGGLQQEAGSAAAEPAQIPYKKERADTSGALGDVFLVLTLLILGGGAVLVILKKRLSLAGLIPSEKGKHIALLDRQALHGDHVVYYLTVDGKSYVLCVGNGHSSISKVD